MDASRLFPMDSDTLRTEYQFMNGITNNSTNINGMNMRHNIAYVVLTYFFPISKLPVAKASPSLFFKPLLSPMLKKLIQATIELKVSQMP